MASLESLGFQPEPGGELNGFSGERRPVALRVTLADGLTLGWSRQADGSLALVADLQRLSRSAPLEAFLTTLTRAYAAREALDAATLRFPGAHVRIGA